MSPSHGGSAQTADRFLENVDDHRYDFTDFWKGHMSFPWDGMSYYYGGSARQETVPLPASVHLI